MVHNFTLHDHLYIPAAGLVLPFSCARECTQGLLIYVCLRVELNYICLVRVGKPQKIFKPHSQISRLGMWTICFHIPKDYIYFRTTVFPRIDHACTIYFSALIGARTKLNEFIITIGFGGRGTRSIRGRVLFGSNNATVHGLIEGAV